MMGHIGTPLAPLTVDITKVQFLSSRSLILGPSISKPDSLFPADLFAFGKSGREN